MKVKHEIIVREYNDGNKEILVFSNQAEYDPLWYFLNYEVGQFEAWIKDNLQEVILTQKQKTISGNICTAIITPTHTTIIDNFAGEAGKEIDRCVVDTRKLLRAVNWWSDFVREWKRTGEKDSIHGTTGELDL